MSKERLVELLNGFKYSCLMSCKDGFAPVKNDCDLCVMEQLAEYLIANGVIVSPCKVGDVVYFPCEEEQKCWEETIVSEEKRIRYYCNDGSEFSSEHVGKSVFLSREEAEAKLKERENNVKP